LLPSRRSAACIIAMSVELHKVGEWHGAVPTLNRAKLNFEQGQVSAQLRNSLICGLAPHSQKPFGSNGSWRSR
jgi:hypothetical protein